jgi:pyruvate formate lyase activating enzyme
MNLNIKNVEKSSTVDYPPYISCVIFFGGCNFRCPYCYNPDIIDPNNDVLPTIPEEEIIEWLKTRIGKLDAVVLSGGEATLKGDALVEFALKIKDLGFKTKLDTNGSNPETIKKLIDLKAVDFISVDIKSDIKEYETACGTKFDTNILDRTVELIKSSDIDHEFRTTVVPGIHTTSTICDIIRYLGKPKKYALQGFKALNTYDIKLQATKPYDIKTLNEMASEAIKISPDTKIEVRY